jgi:hypothetical protein
MRPAVVWPKAIITVSMGFGQTIACCLAFLGVLPQPGLFTGA